MEKEKKYRQQTACTTATVRQQADASQNHEFDDLGFGVFESNWKIFRFYCPPFPTLSFSSISLTNTTNEYVNRNQLGFHRGSRQNTATSKSIICLI